MQCRRYPVLITFLAILIVPLVAEAQQAGKTARIGYLHVNPVTSSPSPLRVAFIQALRDFGWVEGSNLAIEIRSANGKPERLPALIAELIRLKVDLIFAAEPVAAAAAKRVTAEVPIVFMTGGDPVVGGLVASLARPGGNPTGCAGMEPELAGKRLELLKQIVPRLTRVAFVINPSSPMSPHHVREAHRRLPLHSVSGCRSSRSGTRTSSRGRSW